MIKGQKSDYFYYILPGKGLYEPKGGVQKRHSPQSEVDNNYMGLFKGSWLW